MNQNGSILKRFCYQIFDSLKGINLLIVSVLLLINVLKSNNNMEFKTNYFVLILFIIVFLILLILYTIVRLNKSRFELIDRSLSNEKRIDYYYSTTQNTNKIKEIKMYSVYEYIRNLLEIRILKSINIRKKACKMAIVNAVLISTIVGLFSSFLSGFCIRK